MPLRAADSFGRVETGKYKLDTRRSHGRTFAGVDFKGLVPNRWHPFQQRFVVNARQHITDLDFHAFGKDLRDRFETVLLDIFCEHCLDGFRDHRIQDLSFAHLMTAHQVNFQLTQ